MTWFDEFKFSDEKLFKYKNLNFLFVEHGNYYFSLKAKELIASLKFDAIALDIEKKWSRRISAALEDFPEPTLLASSEYFMLVEPVEAFFQAAFSAKKHHVDLHYFRASGICNPVVPQDRTPEIFDSLIGNSLYYDVFLRKGAKSKHSKMLTWYSAGYLNYLNSVYKNVLVFIEPELFYDTFAALRHGGEWAEFSIEDDDIVKIDIPNSLLSLLCGEFPLLNDLLFQFKRKSENYLEIYNDLNKTFFLANKHLRRKTFSIPNLLKQALNYSFKIAYLNGELRPDFFFLLKSIKMFFDDETALDYFVFANKINKSQFDDFSKLEHRGRLNEIMKNTIGNYFSYPRRALRKIQFRMAPPKPKREKWAKTWKKDNVVSWPPEDIAIERFRSYVFSNSLRMINLNRVRVDEFKGSLKDGIDFRETMRKAYEKKIYVKEIPKVKGRVGAKIIVFDEVESRYPYRSTWYAEHPEESVISFYAEDPRNQVVGPGIARSNYGAILMIYPPRVFPDIWKDPFFIHIKNPVAKLVLAGIIYSNEKYIAYIAKKKHPEHYKDWAARYHKKLIYIPFSDFSQGVLEKIRNFHVLNNPDIRKIANDFIN